MAEWQVEQGIGEDRAIRLDGGEIAEARVEWPGRLAAGLIADALLVSRTSGAARGTLRFACAEEALVDGLPRDAREGAPLRVLVTRAALAEAGRGKLARARPVDLPCRPAPSLADRLRDEGHDVRIVRRFTGGDWDDLFAEAWDGAVAFPGGSLAISPTPAMTVIDIDGTLPPAALALAAVPPLAASIGRLALAGSIGIDFPTLADKADRRAVDAALVEVLAGWRHERTAINGFGFVQLVSRLEAPSLVQRIAADRAGAAARLLLRRAEAVSDAGAIELSAHPAVLAAIRPDWLDDLARRTGRSIRPRPEPALALAGGFAQAVPS